MDYTADIAKYTSNVDEAAVKALASRYRLVMSQPDSAVVAFTDPDELERVRENFLIKRLGLSADDDLEGGISAVGEKMKGVSRKSRLTVYYLLAEHFWKLGSL